MYKSQDNLVGCALIGLLILFIIAISFGFIMLIAKLILIVSLNLFDYNLNDKYWYVVMLIIIINSIFGSKIKFNSK